MEKASTEAKAHSLWQKIMKDGKDKVIKWKKSLILASMVMVLGIASFLFYQSGYSYQVSLNGNDIGFVKKAQTIEEAIGIVEEDMIAQYGEDAYFKKEIETKKVRGHKKELVDVAGLSKVISKNVKILKPASIIVVGGEEVVAVDSAEKAEAILEEIKEPYAKAKADEDIEVLEVLEVGFNQEVEIVSKDVAVEEILSRKQALAALGGKDDRIETYTVSRGDTAWDISRSFKMGIEALEKANPGKNIENLKPGEEINLVVPKTLLEVVSIQRHKSTKDVDFKTVEKNDSSIYRGQKKVKEEGKKGKKEVIADVTFINGVESKRKVIEETVIEEPKDKVVLVGTKARPSPSRGGGNRRPAPTYNGSLGPAIVATARHYIGIPYRSRGSSPATGFDCSGFTSYVYRQYGISLPRSSAGQASYGGYVSRSQLMPGDIVVFPGHVGIYVGGGSFIHSPRTGRSIEITSLNNSSYSRKFISGRRPY